MFQNTSVFEWIGLKHIHMSNSRKKVIGVPPKKNPDIKPNKMEYQLWNRLDYPYSNNIILNI